MLPNVVIILILYWGVWAMTHKCGIGGQTIIDWQKDCKDAMWSMFWVGRQHGKRKSDPEGLKVMVARLVRLATQKTAGQRGAKKDLDWNSLTPTIMNICIEATAMCLNGDLGEMPSMIEEDP